MDLKASWSQYLMEMSITFMLGMFGDTEETIKKTINFAIELNLDQAEFLPATPLPFTKFYEQCGFSEKTTTSLPQRWYNRTYSSDVLLNEGFLDKQIKKAYRRFYFRPSYIFKRLYSTVSLKQLVLQLKLAASLFKTTCNL